MTLIRSCHHYQFRSGKWARLVGLKEVNNRQCYEVRFPDGEVDLWVVTDELAKYEFKEYGRKQYKLAVWTRIDGVITKQIGDSYAA